MLHWQVNPHYTAGEGEFSVWVRRAAAERDVGEVVALVRLSEWPAIQVRRTFSPSSCQQNCDSLQPNITGPAMQWAIKFFNPSVGGNALLVLR
jgi:hypothetical protein